MINDYLRIKKLIKNSIVENIFLDIEDSILIKEENGKYSIIGLEDYVICEMISRDIHKVKLNDEKENIVDLRKKDILMLRETQIEARRIKTKMGRVSF